MAKWKIEFHGFAYVEADSAEEADEKYNDGDVVFQEDNVSDPKEVDSFEVTI